MVYKGEPQRRTNIIKLKLHHLSDRPQRLPGHRSARKTITLMGHLYVDLFTQKRLIIDGVNMHLKLMRSPPAFCIMWSDINIGDMHHLLTKLNWTKLFYTREKSNQRHHVTWESLMDWRFPRQDTVFDEMKPVRFQSHKNNKLNTRKCNNRSNPWKSRFKFQRNKCGSW